MGEDKKSLFNSGVAMAERIDELQRAMNMARFNPLAIMPMIGRYGYEVMISAQDGLLKESWAKLNNTEKIKGDRIKNLVKDFVDANPVMFKTKDGMKVSIKNYNKFLELINIYENNTKIFLDSHNLNSPDSDEDDEL